MAADQTDADEYVERGITIYVDHTYARRRARYLVHFFLGCNDVKLKAGLSRCAGVQSIIYERADERAACSGRREVNELNAT